MIANPRPVLVVEDESAQRLMYTRALKEFGYSPRCESSVQSAQDAMNSGKFGVALLDLNLSGQSGMELFEYIREIQPQTSVVIASGYGTFEIAKRAISMDVVEFLSKPVGLDELKSAIDRAWDRHVLVQTPIAELIPPGMQATGSIVSRPSLNLEDMEHELIVEALKRAGDNRKDAAKLLGISERKLYYRLSQYEIRP